MSRRPSSARDLALLELDDRRLPGWPAHVLRHRPAASSSQPTDARDLALCEQIVTGVIKNLFLLQHLIAHYANRPLKNIDPLLAKIIAIALYQMRFLDRIPHSAAVDQAVEQAKHFGNIRAGGFVNAILRHASREKEVPLPNAADAREYARVVMSHPPEVFDKLQKLAGTQRALQICQHDNREPATIVRLLPGGQPATLSASGVSVQGHEMEGMFVVQGAKRHLLASWAEAGLAQVQDPTAASVARQCNILPGQSVLDRCCGLGTKTLQLSELVGPQGRLIAMDPNTARCAALGQLLAQRGIENVSVHATGNMSDLPDSLPRAFDRILVDAPCGNSGVLARRPEARYAQGSTALHSLAKLQRHILDDTAGRVAPGGLLIYSTCSLWAEENEQQVQSFLSRHAGFFLESQQLTLPSIDDSPTHYHDGGFVAVLRREAK